MLNIVGRWLLIYHYISANPNETRGQTSTSTLTEEGEFQFSTQFMCEPSFNINNYSVQNKNGFKNV